MTRSGSPFECPPQRFISTGAPVSLPGFPIDLPNAPQKSQLRLPRCGTEYSFLECPQEREVRRSRHLAE